MATFLFGDQPDPEADDQGVKFEAEILNIRAVNNTNFGIAQRTDSSGKVICWIAEDNVPVGVIGDVGTFVARGADYYLIKEEIES